MFIGWKNQKTIITIKELNHTIIRMWRIDNVLKVLLIKQIPKYIIKN